MNDHKTYDVAGATAYLLSGGLGETQGLISLAMSTGAQQVSIDADHLQALADLAVVAVEANAAPAARALIAVKALEWFEAGGSHYGQCGDVVAYIIEPSGVGVERPWILLSPYGAIGHYSSPDAAKPAAQDNLAAVIAGFIAAPVAAGWQAIEEAPKDGTHFIGGYWHGSERERRGEVVRCWWQPEFDAFISSCRIMTLAPGLAFENGATQKLHSPEIERVTHWMPLPAAPGEG